MQYRPDIDGLRTLAVVPVLLFHASLGLPGGFVGVDVFFVISGYLITHHLVTEIDKGSLSILRFYERRARRIFPALFAMMLATTLAVAFTMMPYDFEDFGSALLATTLFAANIWFLGQEGYFTEAAELEPLLHAWSLGVEEQYYLVFPLLLLALSRKLSARAAFLALAGLALLSYVGASNALAYAPERAFYLPQLRAWELLIGSLLAIAVVRGWWDARNLPVWLSHVLSGVGLAAIAWPVFTYDAATAFPGPGALAPCLGAALLIAVGANGRGFGTRILALRPMVLIGKLSYSLYLWHWPVISIAYYKLGQLTIATGVACLAVSALLAILSWKFIELPVRNRSRVSNRAIGVGSGGAMTLLIGLGAAIWMMDGLPNRVDPKLLSMAETDQFAHDMRAACHFVTAERARTGDICLRGREGVEPSFVLAGDSHADALSPALFEAAEELGLAGYQFTSSDFLPLPGTLGPGISGLGRTEAFVSFLRDRPQLDTVIISRFWEHQLTGRTYRHEGDLVIDDAYDGSGTSYNAGASRRGLERLAALFPERRFVIIDDVPSGYALHIRSLLRTEGAGIDLTALGLPAQDFDAQRATYEPLLSEVAAAASNVGYHPIFKDLCDGGLCPLFDGETLLYRDGDHLSWEGALRLTPLFVDLLQDLRPQAKRAPR